MEQNATAFPALRGWRRPLEVGQLRFVHLEDVAQAQQELGQPLGGDLVEVEYGLQLLVIELTVEVAQNLRRRTYPDPEIRPWKTGSEGGWYLESRASPVATSAIP